MFMAVSFFIMAMIFLQPAQAVALAAKLPSSAAIGGGIVVLAMLEFLRRFWVDSKRASKVCGELGQSARMLNRLNAI